MSIAISIGSGAASVAADAIGGLQYQQIKVLGGETGSTSMLSVGPDGSAKVSIVGTVATTFSGTPSISGTVNIGDIKQSVFGASVIGTVPVTQTTTPWAVTNVGSIVSTSAGSVITVWQNSSVIGVVTGSVVAIPTGNQSISGTVGASVIGWLPIQPANTSIITRWADSSVISVPVGSTIAYIQNSIAAVIIGGSILTSSTANQSVSGTTGASVIGWVPIQAANTSIITVAQGSIAVAIVSGSVAVATGNSSVQVLNFPTSQSVSGALFISGSVLSQQTGTVITSISGTVSASIQGTVPVTGPFAEDSAHTSGDYGFPIWQVRNDTLSSMTSADGDYSPTASGPVGEAIVANAPLTKWVSGTADLRGNSGTSVAVIAAQGASIFTYITGIQVANMGSASVLVTLSGATSSIIGYTIAPAGGGSNIVYRNALKTNANGAFTTSISGVASVLVSAQGFIAKI